MTAKTKPKQVSFDQDTLERIAYLQTRGRGQGRSDVVRVAIAEMYDRVKAQEG